MHAQVMSSGNIQEGALPDSDDGKDAAMPAGKSNREGFPPGATGPQRDYLASGLLTLGIDSSLRHVSQGAPSKLQSNRLLEGISRTRLQLDDGGMSSVLPRVTSRYIPYRIQWPFGRADYAHSHYASIMADVQITH